MCHSVTNFRLGSDESVSIFFIYGTNTVQLYEYLLKIYPAYQKVWITYVLDASTNSSHRKQFESDLFIGF